MLTSQDMLLNLKAHEDELVQAIKQCEQYCEKNGYVPDKDEENEDSSNEAVLDSDIGRYVLNFVNKQNLLYTDENNNETVILGNTFPPNETNPDAKHLILAVSTDGIMLIEEEGNYGDNNDGIIYSSSGELTGKAEECRMAYQAYLEECKEATS